MKKDAKRKSSNEKCRIKNSILNYNHEITSATSKMIAIKKEKLHVPRSSSSHSKEKKTNKIHNLHEVCK